MSIIVALAFPLVMIRAEHLLRHDRVASAFAMPMYRFGRFSPQIVGLAHRRPLEVCPSIDADYARHTELDAQRTTRGFVRLARFAADYHRTSRAIIMGRCTGGWTWQPGSASHLYAQFARDAPIAWTFGRLGGSEVFIGLFVLASALLGAFGAGRLLFYLSNSNTVVVAGLGAFAWVVTKLFGVFHMDVLWAAYGLLTSWLIACWNRPSAQTLPFAILLPALVAIHLCGYLVVAYSAATGAIAVALFAMTCSFAARPSRRRGLQLAAVAVAVWAVMSDCAAFSQRQLAPISSLNFVGGGSFSEFALTTGFWTERPNPLSFPLGDPGVYAAYRAEPLVGNYATNIFEYQGFKAFGQSLFSATVLRFPLITLAGVCKRVFILTVRLPTLAQPLMRIAPAFIRASQAAAVCTMLLALVVAFHPARWHIELPLLAVALWNTFGIESLTHLVHTHPSYHVYGMMQMLLLAPVLVVIGARSQLPWRKWAVAVRRPIVLVAIACTFVPATVLSYSAAQRELLTFDIWYPPWIGMYRTPLESKGIEATAVRAKIERLRSLGESTPGSISMYGGWMMSRLADNVWMADSGVGEKLHLPSEAVESRRLEARALATDYFRRAAAEAPDNPWIHTFTELWDQNAVTRSFDRMTALYPEHPFASWWTYVLARRTSGPEQLRFAERFEQITHRQLVATAALRPGFVVTPAGGRSIVDPSGEGWTEVRLTDQTAASLGGTDAFGSDRLRLIVDIRAVSGSARATLVADTDDGTVASAEQPISDKDVHTYRVFQWAGTRPARRIALRLRAAGEDAVVRVRDFYPMIENPHVDSLE